VGIVADRGRFTDLEEETLTSIGEIFREVS